MNRPKRRYIVASLVGLFAAGALYVEQTLTWQIVAVVILAATIPLGAHAIDHFSAGPLEYDPDHGGEKS